MRSELRGREDATKQLKQKAEELKAEDLQSSLAELRKQKRQLERELRDLVAENREEVDLSGDAEIRSVSMECCCDVDRGAHSPQGGVTSKSIGNKSESLCPTCKLYTEDWSDRFVYSEEE